MYKFGLALLVLISLACKPDDQLNRICGQACAVDPVNNSIVVGSDAEAITCYLGILTCTDQGETCIGYVYPSIERCEDGFFDADCSGDPDDISYQFFEDENDCPSTELGVCKASTKLCINDTWVCIPPEGLFGQEVCDGLDNDCDGLEDSDDPDLYSEGLEFIYTGSPETLNVGECRAGVRRCEEGNEYLFGEVLPTEEICGNDDDDDCDGFTDEEEDPSIFEAFSIKIDFSGSMSYVIEDLIDALCTWGTSSVFVNSQFAIMAVGGVVDYGNHEYLNLITNFTDVTTACLRLEEYYIRHGANGGSEYIPWSIYSGQHSVRWNLVWPEGVNRRVVFFTDEYPQGYRDPERDELLLVADDCQVNDYSVGGFTSVGNALWTTMTNPCRGWLEPLTTDSQQMQDALNKRFGIECGQ
jgi:hypothetical protein